MKILLASHGELSKGILSSIEMILGEIPMGIDTFCLYPGANPQDYVDELEIKIKNDLNETHLIFTDIEGGSVNTACMQLARYENVFVLAGMNLLLVLELILKKERCTRDDMKRAVENARNGIIFHDNFEKDMNQSEDF